MSTVRDPARLVAGASVSDAELALLRQGIDMAPPPGAEARVWQGLAGVLGAAALGGAAAAADASTKTATTAATKVTGAAVTAAKVVAVVAGLAGLAALGAKLLTSANQARPPAAAGPVAAPAPAAAPAPPPVPPQELPPPAEGAQPPSARAKAKAKTEAKTEAKTTRAAARTAGATPPAASSAGRLREETTLIREARQALRQGDAARALRLLDEGRRLFPAGVLQQERERLAIEALTRSGRAAEASARAAAFLRKYPDSPHAAEIRALGR